MNDWDYSVVLKQLYEQPEKNKCNLALRHVDYVDILQYGNEKPTANLDLVLGQAANAPPGRLENWLNNEPPLEKDDQVLTGGLRLISHYIQDFDDSHLVPMVPWPEDDLKRILQSFKLPPRPCVQMLLGERTSFASFSPKEPGWSHGRFAYVFSTSSSGEPYWSVVASYDPKRNLTYAYLRYLSRNPTNTDLLWDYVTNLQPFGMHPLLLPVLIAGIETSRLLGSYEYEFRSILTLDRKFSNTVTDKLITVDPSTLPLDDIVAELMHDSTKLTACWRDTETWSNALPLLRRAIDEVWRLVKESPPFSFKEVSDQLVRQVKSAELQNRSVEPVFHATERIGDRILNRMDNYYSQKDNKLSRQIANTSIRDGTAMKVLSIVTMVFLPGTFVASFFATPFFQWDVDKGSQIVSHRFWIYWAVTAPLTLFVLALWFIWSEALITFYDVEHLEIPRRDVDGPRGNISGSEHQGGEGMKQQQQQKRKNKKEKPLRNDVEQVEIPGEDVGDSNGNLPHSKHQKGKPKKQQASMFRVYWAYLKEMARHREDPKNETLQKVQQMFLWEK